MLNEFKKSITELQKYGLHFSPSGENFLLLAVSGGVDSVVMADLFYHSGIKCAVAHCNFQLRGNDADNDEKFVKTLAEKYYFPFHSIKFETENFAQDNGLSIQMAARKLRYNYFDELIKVNNYTNVAVAHHRDDIAETLLLNLTRGAGIAGMHGIRPVNGLVIRPLLFAYRLEIEAYAKAHNLVWREDSTNADNYYQRNRIRNQVIPQLTAINPSAVNAMVKHAEIMNDYEVLIDEYIQKLKSELISFKQKGIICIIDLLKLKSLSTPSLVLYHFLKDNGFSAEICEEILNTNRTGAHFSANGFTLTIGRNELQLINDEEIDIDETVLVNEFDQQTTLEFGSIEMNHFFGIENIDINDKNEFSNRDTAFIDGDKLLFPLKLRRWKTGDAFFPLGMKGKKLLSDYFTDLKFSKAQKETTYVLLSEDQIVWIVGHRIDNRFKLSDNSNSIRKFNWHPNT